MVRSKLGFHTGPGGMKNGLGDWERALNQAGQPYGLKCADEYGPLHEAVQIGRDNNIQNWLVFRLVAKSGKVSRETPNYNVAPRADAHELCAEVLGKLPPEFDKSVWLEIINEPRDENRGDDTSFNNMNVCDYLGEWCLAAAQYLNERGYKFAGPSFNAGEPGREGHPLSDAVTQYSQPGMLKFLRYAAANPEKAALSVHEYSWSLWEEGQTAAEWYPGLWGRFEAAIAAADRNGIPRTFHIFVTEFGFAHRKAPQGAAATAYLDARNRMVARWPQLKFDAGWTMQSGWDDIDKQVNTWLKYDARREFDPGEQPARTHADFGGTLPGQAPAKPPVDETSPPKKKPPITTPPSADAAAKRVWRLAFTGWGEKDVAKDPSLGAAAWYDVDNVQVPIIDGRRLDYWQASGANRFADGQPWNDFAPPEGVHRWDALLPPNEHDFLNDEGRCYHLFAPSQAWWVRYSLKTPLAAGTYRLSLDLWGDWVDIKDNKKVPKPDPNHARVELFIGDDGREQWLAPSFLGPKTLQREITVAADGEVAVGFGILTVFAPGGGKAANGCFLRAFTVERVGADETSLAPGGGLATGDSGQKQGDDSTTATELLRQIVVPPAGGVDTLRLELRDARGALLKSVTERLPAGGQLALVYLRGAPATTDPIAKPPVSDLKAGPLQKWVTAVDGLNVRDGPSRAHEVLTSLPHGTVVEVLVAGDFDQIRVGDLVGYASSKYLALVAPDVSNGAAGSGFAGGADDAFRFRVWPTVDKRVTQHFGRRPDYYRKITKGFLPAHEGIDLSAPFGTPYYCVAPGVVSRVSDRRSDGTASNYGWFVVVEHADGYSTLYAHATPDILVKEGDQVLAGQILAHSGKTGNADAPHLHLTLKREGHQLEGWPPGYMDPWPQLEPLFNQLRPPIGNLREGYLHAPNLERRANQMALTQKNLNMRATPDGDGVILAVVPAGRTVRILREPAENQHLYCEVSYDEDAQPKKILRQPQATKIDLLPYIRGDGRQYEVKNEWGSQERFQIQEEGTTFYLVKNTQWEQFFFDQDFIYRDVDTSPGGGRYYRLKDADRQRGTRWLRRRMAVGEQYTQARQVQFYHKANGAKSAENSGSVTDTIELVAHHKKRKFQTGLEVEDVVELRWVNGGERYFYARGFGLVGWSRDHQDPNTPAWSAVAEIHAPGAREPFTRERVALA